MGIVSEKIFKFRVQRKMKRENYNAYQMKDSECPVDLLRISKDGSMAGVKCRAHGHINNPEKKKLLSLNIPIFVASEKYGTEPDVHDIKMVKI